MADTKIIVYFIRHAESEKNDSFKMDSSQDQTLSNGLTDLGKLQAYKLGEHLQNEKLSRVFSSDYMRAVQTAECVLEMNKCQNRPNIRVSKKLRDIDFGTLTGAPYAEITRHYVKSGKPLREWTLPDGEKYKDTGLRMACYFEQICETARYPREANEEDSENKGITVLIFSHSLSLAALFHHFSWTDQYEMVNWNGEADVKILKNACYYKLQVSRADLNVKEDGRLRIEVLERFASAHLACFTKDLLPTEVKLGKDNKENGKTVDEKIKLRMLLGTSQKGREILSCCQQ